MARFSALLVIFPFFILTAEVQACECETESLDAPVSPSDSKTAPDDRAPSSIKDLDINILL
jgi:hypothetical protein